MTANQFELNIKSQCIQYLKRTACAKVMHGSPPTETDVTFEHYSVLGVEFVAIAGIDGKDEVRLFAPCDYKELRARIDAALR